MNNRLSRWNIRDAIFRGLHSEPGISNNLAVLIGIFTGLTIVAYDFCLKYAEGVFWNGAGTTGHYYVIFIPAIGGLFVGVVTHLYKDLKRCNVAEVIEGTALHGGRIRIREAFREVFLSIVSIATGGSVGKEAPGILAGAGIGTIFAKTMHAPDNRYRIFLGCGASGGIAAAFNAPLAGVVFVVEVILGELETRTFIPIVLSSVFATLVANLIFEVHPIEVSYYGLVDPIRESGLYLVLGILCGIASVIIIRTLYLTHDVFQKIPVHPAFKPAIGGLFVGFIGYFYPQVRGIGYNVITEVLANNFTLQLLLILLVLKILAFSFTIGSGNAGGSIIPSMFVGAMLGGAYGTIVHQLFPASTAVSGAYALVGMAATLAGTVRAPLTSMLILFELTKDYNLILPLMFACVVSNSIANGLHEESIFTEVLKRRGFTIRRGKEINVMESMLVKGNMITDVHTLSMNDTAKDLLDLMQSSRHAGFPVLDENKKLRGIVTLEDMRDKVNYGELDTKISEIATLVPVVAYPDESLDVVLKRLAMRDIGRLPVVSRTDEANLLGIITRSDVVKSYNKEIVKSVHEKDIQN
ncbi:chloride channel protein [Methanococcoides methylutens]|uniref:Putative voltage-gated ClC-type chloride channel ClcB n=1 Tax=Methanococcoides methylutens MM1 TaxID=1434104 RepID=A0A0E3X0N4_METMT|nr:chloride channel protein [Methanococcoides methylutens]AKB85894.1 putative voltage-gated ClC-type chloride channel ClcB [Methanococcoides methylutens MM1]